MTVKEEITKIFILSKKRYGSRRIAAELQRFGYQLSSNTVLIYMRELNLYVSVKGTKPELKKTYLAFGYNICLKIEVFYK